MFDRLRRRSRERRLQDGGMSSAHGDGGVYTREIPPRGAGHYILDPTSSCEIHSRRLEAFCDIDKEATARDEIHGHAENLSRLAIDPESIRTSTEPLIDGRLERRIAQGRLDLEREMAALEGDVESAQQRTESQITNSAHARDRARELTDRADRKRLEAAEMRHRHQQLDRRYRISPSKDLITAKAIAVILYDLSAVVMAFDLIPGTLLTKGLLALGLAFAPLVAAIGIASWLSAANHPVRFGRAAGRYALIVAIVGGLGLLLMIPFRVAALGDNVIAPLAFSFLSVIQVALIMSETASWMVWFDARIGRTLEARIDELEREANTLQRSAESEGEKADKALSTAEEIERHAARSRALLRREEPLRREIEPAESGTAQTLKGIRDTAIEEGRAGINRDNQQRAREGDLPFDSPVPPS
jgi:hypothetical protein